MVTVKRLMRPVKQLIPMVLLLIPPPAQLTGRVQEVWLRLEAVIRLMKLPGVCQQVKLIALQSLWREIQ